MLNSLTKCYMNEIKANLLIIFTFQKPDLTITHHVNFVINQGNKHVGTIVLGLYGRVAPRTVRNFVEIASGRQPKKYEGTAFHRVIQKFMLQGLLPSFTHTW